MFIHFIANGISLHLNYKITNKVTIHMGIHQMHKGVCGFFLSGKFATSFLASLAGRLLPLSICVLKPIMTNFTTLS